MALAAVAGAPGAAEQPSRPVSARELILRNTGWASSPEHYHERASAYALLKAQTERLATALESQGVPARIDVGDVVHRAAVTHEVSRDEVYRSICFLPLIAQRERRPILNALRYFQRHDEHGEHLRLAVVTAGARVPLGGDLRGQLAVLHRRVSRWAHDARRLFGVLVFYRGSEFTVDDRLTFHPHANIIFAPRRRLPAHRWREFLSWSRGRLGAHWKDCGRLEKPDEAIKYPFKPADLDALDAPALAWLYHETARLKLCQPMGAFASFRRQLDAGRLKVAMVNAPGGARLELVERASREPADAGALDLERENVVLCVTAPQFRFGPWAQPVIQVLNYTETPRTAAGAKRLSYIRKIECDALDTWSRNGAPTPAVARAVAAGQEAAAPGAAGAVVAFKVHTSRSTVQGDARPSGGADAATHDLGEGCSATGPAWEAPATFTMEDGTMIDPETGEVLYEPPADLAERRRQARAAIDAHGDAVERAAADGLARAAETRRFVMLMAEKNAGAGRLAGRP